MRSLLPAGLLVATAALALAGPAQGAESFCTLQPVQEGNQVVFALPGDARDGTSRSWTFTQAMGAGPSAPQQATVEANPALPNVRVATDGSAWGSKIHVAGTWTPETPTSLLFDDHLLIHSFVTVDGATVGHVTTKVPLYEATPAAPGAYSFDAWFSLEYHPTADVEARLDNLAMGHKFALGWPDPHGSSGTLKAKIALEDGSGALQVPAGCPGHVEAESVKGDEAVLGPGSDAPRAWGPMVVTAGLGIAGLACFRTRRRA